jgi:hypothetical protein
MKDKLDRLVGGDVTVVKANGDCCYGILYKVSENPVLYELFDDFHNYRITFCLDRVIGIDSWLIDTDI